MGIVYIKIFQKLMGYQSAQLIKSNFKNFQIQIFKFSNFEIFKFQNNLKFIIFFFVYLNKNYSNFTHGVFVFDSNDIRNPCSNRTLTLIQLMLL